MTVKEIFENYDNLSEDELIKKSNKRAYVWNFIMTFIIKHCRGEKRGKRKIDGFRKKIKIQEFEISEFSECKVK